MHTTNSAAGKKAIHQLRVDIKKLRAITELLTVELQKEVNEEFDGIYTNCSNTPANSRSSIHLSGFPSGPDLGAPGKRYRKHLRQWKQKQIKHSKKTIHHLNQQKILTGPDTG